MCHRTSSHTQILHTPESMHSQGPLLSPRFPFTLPTQCWALTLLERERAARICGLRKLWASQGVLCASPGMMKAGVLALTSRDKTEALLLLHGAAYQGVSFRLEPLLGEGEWVCVADPCVHQGSPASLPSGEGAAYLRGRCGWKRFLCILFTSLARV